jgi:hypothetical protein
MSSDDPVPVSPIGLAEQSLRSVAGYRASDVPAGDYDGARFGSPPKRPYRKKTPGHPHSRLENRSNVVAPFESGLRGEALVRRRFDPDRVTHRDGDAPSRGDELAEPFRFSCACAAGTRGFAFDSYCAAEMFASPDEFLLMYVRRVGRRADLRNNESASTCVLFLNTQRIERIERNPAAFPGQGFKKGLLMPSPGGTVRAGGLRIVSGGQSASH